MGILKKEKRFFELESQSLNFSDSCKVIVDRETGINYLYINSGTCGGLTVLLNSDGKPIIMDTSDRQDLFNFK